MGKRTEYFNEYYHKNKDRIKERAYARYCEKQDKLRNEYVMDKLSRVVEMIHECRIEMYMKASSYPQSSEPMIKLDIEQLGVLEQKIQEIRNRIEMFAPGISKDI